MLQVVILALPGGHQSFSADQVLPGYVFAATLGAFVRQIPPISGSPRQPLQPAVTKVFILTKTRSAAVIGTQSLVKQDLSDVW